MYRSWPYGRWFSKNLTVLMRTSQLIGIKPHSILIILRRQRCAINSSWSFKQLLILSYSLFGLTNLTIFSTTMVQWKLRTHNWISKTNLKDIWEQRPNQIWRTQMCSHGGRHIVMTFPTFIEWQWTIILFQVSSFFFGKLLYLTVFSSATSVDVERVFSKGRLVLSHIRNRLSAQSTRRLMCLGAWSQMGYVKGQDIKVVTSSEPELKATGHIEW